MFRLVRIADSNSHITPCIVLCTNSRRRTALLTPCELRDGNGPSKRPL